MNIKDEIIQILEYETEFVENQDGCSGMAIWDNDFEATADRVVKLFAISNVSKQRELLIAWEQFKKDNWWESDTIDVEKVLMDQFTAIYSC